MKKSSLRAQQMNRTVLVIKSAIGQLQRVRYSSHLAVVVLVQSPVSTGVDLLVALVGSTTAQSGVHVHVVARHVQADQSLEDNGPPRPCGAQKDQQTRRGAAICHHVQDRTESGRLIEVSGSISIQCIQQTGHAIQDGAGARVKGHVVEGGNGEDDSGVPCTHVRRPRSKLRMWRSYR